MVFFRLLVICLVLLSMPSSATEAQSLSASAARHDLDFLQRALYQCHPGAFLYNSRSAFDSLFQALRAQIPPDSIKRRDMHCLVQQAVAAVRDGHTSVSTLYYDNQTRVLPVLAQWAQGDLYVWRNYTSDTSLQRGARLLAVNGLTMDSFMHYASTVTFGDGYNRTFSQAIIPVYFSRLLYLFKGDTAQYMVEAINAKGDTTRHTLLSITRKDLQKLQQTRLREQRRQPLAPRLAPIMFQRGIVLRRDTALPSVAILTLNNFPSKGYKHFYRKVFEWLDKQEVQTLVIDVRNNTGGNIRNMDRLTAYIVPETFTYEYARRRHTRAGRFFKGWHKLTLLSVWLKYNTQPGFKYRREGDWRVQHWQVKPRKRHHYQGKTYVLTNGWSFSSASLLTSFLKNKGGATVVGEETGGNETGNCGGGFPKLILPHSKMKIRFPLFMLRYGVEKPKTGHGVIPDMPTTYTIEDLLKGRDLDMEAVRSLVRGKGK